MVREAIFSSLASRVGALGRVADLYCGSGAMGIEALSRGATACTFVDDDPRCLAAARRNLDAVGLGDAEASFVRATLPGWRLCGHYDVVLCDPPYGELDAVRLVDGLDAEVVVVETDAALEPLAAWEVTSERRYGGTLVTMLTRRGNGDAT